MIICTCDEPYPIPVPDRQGAVAQFLIRPGNFLQIIWPGMDDEEQAALESGLIKAGLLYEGGDMLLLFQFSGTDDQPELTFDAPYNIRMLPADNRRLPSIDNSEQQLAFEIHAIDENKILRVIRSVSMA